MEAQELYRLRKADSTETIPCFFEEDLNLRQLEKLKVVDEAEEKIAMLDYFYADSQLNQKERQMIRDFLQKRLEWPEPICTILYNEAIEEDKDNGVMLRVKRYIEMNTTTWTLQLLKTAECLQKIPRFAWAKYYAM
ncbi:unnamed protein product [Cylicocyclus nassatus]|uniref:Uncharacterized protein n=1 Tax=Cylicocyclus nassatus TaxID=53992 RepID=A0AA36GUH4_CYLNA|nr:unnamed protein product [Cylicocyclus nassatus]